jgi:hypothetical protein
MNKKTKMWIGVGVVAAAAYYFWQKSQTPATTTTKQFVAADGIFKNGVGDSCGTVPCHSGEVMEGGWSAGPMCRNVKTGNYTCRNKYNK